jgi:hypothetical protein
MKLRLALAHLIAFAHQPAAAQEKQGSPPMYLCPLLRRQDAHGGKHAMDRSYSRVTLTEVDRNWLGEQIAEGERLLREQEGRDRVSGWESSNPK